MLVLQFKISHYYITILWLPIWSYQKNKIIKLYLPRDHDFFKIINQSKNIGFGTKLKKKKWSRNKIISALQLCWLVRYLLEGTDAKFRRPQHPPDRRRCDPAQHLHNIRRKDNFSSVVNSIDILLDSYYQKIFFLFKCTIPVFSFGF